MVEVIHTPHGQEHPYQQLPEERAPRQPLAGDPFIVGIVTRPSGAVKNVTVRQRLGSSPLSDAPATHLVGWLPALEEGVGAEYLQRVTTIDQDVWQAQLTAPAAGETLTYWIETDAGVRSPEYAVYGESWQTGGSAILDGSHLTFTRAGKGAVPHIPGMPALEKIEWLDAGDRARRVRLTFRAAPDERFFGLGERFNALNQRGNLMDIRCYEQYKNQNKRAYMPIPFLLSSAGYGVWVESSRWMQFDIAASSPDLWTVEADLGADETISLSWFTGDDPTAITGQFARATGPAALPPLWSFGLWMSSNEWNSQARTVQEVQASFDHGIQPTVVVLEAWSDEATFYIWNDAVYTPKPGSQAFSYADFSFPPEGKWHDPAGMVNWLHEHGLKLVLWQIPVIKLAAEAHAQHDADRAHYVQAGFGVREPDGDLYRVRPSWFRGSFLFDPTNEAEREWWMSKRAYLVDELGIDGFKTDGGEHLWGTHVHFADGRRGDELWNEYPQRYTEAYYQFAQRNGGVTFSRAGFTGSQRSPIHWAGDEASTWDAYRHSILAGLSAGISGIPFWSYDIGGFSGDTPTAELYLRSAAQAVFCPVMQYHSENFGHREPNHDRTPWNIQQQTGDDRVIPLFRWLVNLRHNLMPYIWQEAQHAAATGEPIMRALKLWHAQADDYAYYFGRDLLVYPVVEQGAESRTLYLPPGEWIDLWTRDTYAGDQTITVSAPLEQIPVFVRSGARLPVRLADSGKLGDFVTLSADPTAYLFE